MDLSGQDGKHGDLLLDLKTIVVAWVKIDHYLIKADAVEMEEGDQFNLVSSEHERQELRQRWPPCSLT